MNASARIEGIRLLEWMAKAIPSDEDAIVRSWLSDVVANVPRSELAAVLRNHSQALQLGALRAAIEAVRSSSRELTEWAALSIAAEGCAEREPRLLLPVIWDAADRIGADPAEVFRMAAESGAKEAEAVFKSFIAADKSLKALESVGYHFTSENGGNYSFRWPALPIVKKRP